MNQSVLPHILLGATALMGTLALGVPESAAAERGFRAPFARALFVRNDADSGPGSLRRALERASEDPRVTRIVVRPGLHIDLTSAGLIYSGEQALSLVGPKVEITGRGDFDLLTVSSGADLNVNGLGFHDSTRRGLAVVVPPEREGTVEVSLQNVTFEDNDLFAVHVDDLAGSPASVSLRVVHGRFEDNGIPALAGSETDDQDAIRVDERGDGSIEANIRLVHVAGNAYDGVELDEAGPGDVSAKVYLSTFADNGHGSLGDGDGTGFDYEDGFDIDEAGPGSIFVDVFGARTANSPDEGWDFDEADDGSIVVEMASFEVTGCGKGISFHESQSDDGDGDVVFHARHFLFTENEDAVQIRETRDGDVDVELVHGEFLRNEDVAAITEIGDGSLTALVQHVRFENNLDDVLELDENQSGDNHSVLRDVQFLNNGGRPLFVDRGRGTEDEGVLTLRDVVFSGNDIDEPVVRRASIVVER